LNENTNGLLRQYFPKNTDLTDYSQSDLNKVALRLNQRPRKILGFQTPARELQESLCRAGEATRVTRAYQGASGRLDKMELVVDSLEAFLEGAAGDGLEGVGEALALDGIAAALVGVGQVVEVY
jgi:hypothetical protein